MAIVQEWLSRSGQLPLSIRVLSYLNVSYATGQAVLALADIIDRYSTRWSDFDLCVPHYFYQSFHATDNHAPILKSIHFHGQRTSRTYNFQLTCPRLERATFLYFSMR